MYSKKIHNFNRNRTKELNVSMNLMKKSDDKLFIMF